LISQAHVKLFYFLERNRVRLPEERGDPLLRKVMEERRARGKIATHFVQSMKHHQENVEALANKKKPERLRTTFDFDIWGEAGMSFRFSPAKNIGILITIIC
jgi:hypothetical protein